MEVDENHYVGLDGRINISCLDIEGTCVVSFGCDTPI